MKCVRYIDCWSALFDLRKCLCNAFVQLLRSLHINQQSHMIFTHLAKTVEQNECISTLQELSKSIHYRNSSEAFKLSSLQNVRRDAREVIRWRLNSPQCLQRFNAASIITQCALDRFSILLIIWNELTSSFKMSFRLYISLSEFKCY